MRTGRNIQAQVIYEELYSVYGDQTPCLRTLERWCKQFREGQEELADEAQPGRPITKTTSENIEQVRLIVNDNPSVTIEELQEQTGLSYGTTQRNITDHLHFIKSPLVVYRSSLLISDEINEFEYVNKI